MNDRPDAPRPAPIPPPKEDPPAKPEEGAHPDEHIGTGQPPMHAGDAPDVD